MVINRKLQFVYLALPRTASRTITSLLMSVDGSELHGMHHCMDVPSDCRDFLVATVVRDPFHRAFSEWCRYQSETEMPTKPGRTPLWRGKSFCEFCDGLQEYSKLFPSMCELLGRNRIDLWARFEDISSLLGANRFKSESASRMHDEYSSFARKQVSERFADDLSAFGYHGYHDW